METTSSRGGYGGPEPRSEIALQIWQAEAADRVSVDLPGSCLPVRNFNVPITVQT